MKIEFEILHRLFSIAKESSNPTQYKFMPHELILRLPFEWSEIENSLDDLDSEGLVTLIKKEGFVCSITQKRIEMSKELIKQQNDSFSSQLKLP